MGKGFKNHEHVKYKIAMDKIVYKFIVKFLTTFLLILVNYLKFMCYI